MEVGQLRKWWQSNGLKLFCVLLILAGTVLSLNLTSQIEQAKLIRELGIVIHQPPDGWNPLTATDAELAYYNYPPRPQNDPAALEQWKQVVSGRWVRPIFSKSNIQTQRDQPVDVIASPAIGLSGAAIKPEEEIALIFRYGYGTPVKNELNTLNNTYTKDMIGDPPVTTHLSLSKGELDTIISKMKEIGFFGYPDWFSVPTQPGGMVGCVTPFESYYFRVECDSGAKGLYWDDNITNANKDADKLRELIRLIKGIVESKPEYQRLPAPRGGYD